MSPETAVPLEAQRGLRRWRLARLVQLGVALGDAARAERARYYLSEEGWAAWRRRRRRRALGLLGLLLLALCLLWLSRQAAMG
jgi:hypothetical protein